MSGQIDSPHCSPAATCGSQQATWRARNRKMSKESGRQDNRWQNNDHRRGKEHEHSEEVDKMLTRVFLFSQPGAQVTLLLPLIIIGNDVAQNSDAATFTCAPPNELFALAFRGSARPRWPSALSPPIFLVFSSTRENCWSPSSAAATATMTEATGTTAMAASTSPWRPHIGKSDVTNLYYFYL